MMVPARGAQVYECRRPGRQGGEWSSSLPRRSVRCPRQRDRPHGAGPSWEANDAAASQAASRRVPKRPPRARALAAARREVDRTQRRIQRSDEYPACQHCRRRRPAAPCTLRPPHFGARRLHGRLLLLHRTLATACPLTARTRTHHGRHRPACIAPDRHAVHRRGNRADPGTGRPLSRTIREQPCSRYRSNRQAAGGPRCAAALQRQFGAAMGRLTQMLEPAFQVHGVEFYGMVRSLPGRATGR